MKLILLSIILSSCATELSSIGKAVKLTKNDPPSNCKELGDVDESKVLCTRIIAMPQASKTL